MMNWLHKKLKSTSEFLIHNIFWAILTSFITVPLFLTWVTGTFNSLLLYAQKPAPIWAVIFLVVFVAIYIHIIKLKNDNSSNHKVFLMEVSDVKWKVTDKKNGLFSLSTMPYCKYHDSKYVITPGGDYMCPMLLTAECKSITFQSDGLNVLRSIAESKAEKLINNYETKR